MFRLFLLVMLSQAMHPYWQAADIQLIAGTGGGVQAFCPKCNKRIGAPAGAISIADAKKIARKHKHSK